MSFQQVQHTRENLGHINKCPKHLLVIDPHTNQIMAYIKPRVVSIHQIQEKKKEREDE